MTIETIDPTGDLSPLDTFSALRRLRRPFLLSGGTLPYQRRYSFVSAEPFMELTTENGLTTLSPAPGSSTTANRNTIRTSKSAGTKEFTTDPFSALSEILATFKGLDKGPFPFNGGGVGYFAYELKDAIGGATRNTPGNAHNKPATLPTCSIGFYDPIIVYDHVEEKSRLVSSGTPGSRERSNLIKDALSGFDSQVRGPAGGFSNTTASGFTPNLTSNFTSNFTKGAYLRAIARALEYIAAGDIYQINLSQRLKLQWTGDPFAFYRALLKDDAARFPSYIDCGDFQLISNSPERLLGVNGRIAITEPIKGTRRRGSTPEEDQRLSAELKDCPKEKAEHVMIVDLERNDLGRVSIPGTVEVTDFERIETFPGLHHMTTVVRGALRPEFDAATALRECFPGGSITGAPKIRAMEIIDELEGSPRGVYTGGIGWLDFSGSMDISMAIRTAICQKGALTLGVGGAVVADSDPEDEYDETLLKADKILKAAATTTRNNNDDDDGPATAGCVENTG